MPAADFAPNIRTVCNGEYDFPGAHHKAYKALLNGDRVKKKYMDYYVVPHLIPHLQVRIPPSIDDGEDATLDALIDVAAEVEPIAIHDASHSQGEQARQHRESLAIQDISGGAGSSYALLAKAKAAVPFHSYHLASPRLDSSSLEDNGVGGSLYGDGAAEVHSTAEWLLSSG